jgi:small-conductance mechanosensitive channel
MAGDDDKKDDQLQDIRTQVDGLASDIRMMHEWIDSTTTMSNARFDQICNTPGVAMAGAHLGTQDYDHMWKNLRSKSIRGFGS